MAPQLHCIMKSPSTTTASTHRFPLFFKFLRLRKVRPTIEVPSPRSGEAGNEKKGEKRPTARLRVDSFKAFRF